MELHDQLLDVKVAAVRNMGLEDTGKGEMTLDELCC